MTQPFETEEQFINRTPLPFSTDKLLKNFRPKFLLLQWHLTNQCNLRCKHCYQDDYTVNSDTSQEHLFEILYQYLHLLVKWNIRGHINITGGEPLLNKHLPILLETISKHKHLCSFALLSNGVLLTPQFAKQLKVWGCSFYQISIEGGKEMHDSIRGNGNFEKCIDALLLLRKNKIQTMVSFTSSKLNAHCFDDVVSICKRNRVDVLWSDRYLPIGNGLGIKDEMMQPYEVEAFFAKMYLRHKNLKKSWFNNTELRMHRALNFLVTEKNGCNCYRPYKCSAGRSLITVLPNGDLVPCRRLPVVVGNVFTKSLEEIYENSTFLRMLRKNNSPYKGCNTCPHWDSCNGGLRCLSYAYHGTPFVSDPQCFKINTSLPNMNQNLYF